MEKPGRIRYLLASLLVFLLWYLFAPGVARLMRALPLPEPYHTYLASMVPSLVMALGVWGVSRWFLRAPLSGLIRTDGPRPSLLFVPLASYFLVALLFFLAFKATTPSLYQATHPEPATYLLMLVLIIPLTTIQCSAEEFMMRIIPSHTITNHLISSLLCMALFVIPHLGNNEVTQGASVALVLLYYALFGFFGTWASLDLGGFEFSLGIHIANNLFIALVCNYPVTPMQTAAPYLSLEKVGGWKDLAVLATALALSYLVARKAARR